MPLGSVQGSGKALAVGGRGAGSSRGVFGQILGSNIAGSSLRAYLGPAIIPDGKALNRTVSGKLSCNRTFRTGGSADIDCSKSINFLFIRGIVNRGLGSFCRCFRFEF